MTRSVSSVEYALPEGEQLFVRRLTHADLRWENEIAVGSACLGLLTGAYEKQLEDPQRFDAPHEPLPSGAVEESYNSGPRDAVSTLLRRMRSAMDNHGSQYWLASLTPGSSQTLEGIAYAGLLKITPSRATFLQKMRLSTPNLYIDSITTTPRVWERNIGSCLMHTAVSYAGFKEHKIAALDAFEGSSVNTWFKRLGFKEQDGSRARQRFNGSSHEINQVRMSTEGLTLAGIKANLEKKRSWLGGAQT